ncbi:MAG: bifunctional demethylmenaquinone methyltransferase/2-methoxy-6-polyprenyl-1,4-benzoquinol methylase UbiE, partial [Firmicutes bacterium]|nr:bifunctional demethylmenaquinone methyltransferase/2-methoxy-6-polyprenyl-1,4-benzoquinol methylase UbiE [Bacillota bacterium]
MNGEQTAKRPEDPAAHEAFVQDVFRRIAPHYDRMNSLLSFWAHKQWRIAALRRLDIGAETQALDLCAGTGDFTIALTERIGPRGHVTAVDLTPEMLAIAQEKLRAKGLESRVDLVIADALALPFKASVFDCITVGFGLRNLPDLSVALKEALRVLKPRGTFLSLELSHPPSRLFRSIYLLYFQHIVPLEGRLVMHGDDMPYRWLPTSLQSFPDAPTLALAMQQAGFEEVHYKLLWGGIAALHWG